MGLSGSSIVHYRIGEIRRLKGVWHWIPVWWLLFFYQRYFHDAAWNTKTVKILLFLAFAKHLYVIFWFYVSFSHCWVTLLPIHAEIYWFLGHGAPELLPCGYLVGDNKTINILLKGKEQLTVDGIYSTTKELGPLIKHMLKLNWVLLLTWIVSHCLCL